MRKLSSASPARGLSVVFKTANGRSLELNTEQQVKLIPAIAGIVAQITFESLKKFAPAIGAEIVSKVHQVVRAADEGKTTDGIAQSEDINARNVRYTVTSGVDKALASAIQYGPALLNSFAKLDPAMLQKVIEATTKAQAPL